MEVRKGKGPKESEDKISRKGVKGYVAGCLVIVGLVLLYCLVTQHWMAAWISGVMFAAVTVLSLVIGKMRNKPLKDSVDPRRHGSLVSGVGGEQQGSGQ